MRAVPFAIFAGLAVAMAVRSVSRRPPVAVRIDPWTLPARRRLGQTVVAATPVSVASPLDVVVRSVGRAVSARVRSVLGHRDPEALRLALARAGMAHVDPETWAYQQAAYGAIGITVGGVVGLVGGVRLSVVGAVLGGLLGVLRKRGELDRLTRYRCERIRAELLTVCPVLAVHARATPNVQQVLATVCDRGQGEVVGELRGVLRSVAGGTTPAAALNTAAERTPEPAAARLYRALSVAVSVGGDPADVLIRQASDVRAARRDGRKASAVRRKLAMTGITVVTMAPPLLLFVAAPIPTFLLGS